MWINYFRGRVPGSKKGRSWKTCVRVRHHLHTQLSPDLVPQGASATDPIYSSQINRIKAVLINQLPGFTAFNSAQKIRVATYKPVDFEDQMETQSWLGTLTFEYVLQDLHRDKNGQCSVVRQYVYRNQDLKLGVFACSWPAELTCDRWAIEEQVQIEATG